MLNDDGMIQFGFIGLSLKNTDEVQVEMLKALAKLLVIKTQLQ